MKNVLYTVYEKKYLQVILFNHSVQNTGLKDVAYIHSSFPFAEAI